MNSAYEILKTGHSTKREREEFWRHVIEEQKSGGISILKFCQRHQIPFATFKYMKYVVKAKVAKDICGTNESINNTGKKASFVPVHIVEGIADNILVTDIAKDAKIKIIFKNKHIIEFLPPITEGMLFSIIKQISQLPC